MSDEVFVREVEMSEFSPEPRASLDRFAAGFGLATGAALGLLAGMLIDNLALGIGMGAALGLLIGAMIQSR